MKNKFTQENLKMLVFQGSWCPMCVSAMPQIAQFVANNQIKENRVEIINVNSYKTEPADRIKEYNITRVPTLIILKDGNEVDRITEYAPEGWNQEIESRIKNI